MNTNKTDRLSELLPEIYRQRDAELGYPLRALLSVISEQVNLVEDDILQLFENWFIETAQDWVVPYIGELIGYQPVHDAGEPGEVETEQGRAHNKFLIPRREVANTIRFRRRKGTLPLLEELAAAVAGWPARAVEFYKYLGWTQNINHLHLDRARTVDIRDGKALDMIGGPFESLAHGLEIRRINSSRTEGRYGVPAVGLFVCRLRSYSVTRALARALEKPHWRYFGFSALGNDVPLFVKPQPETDTSHIAEELNLPGPIRRRMYEQNLDAYYGEDKSLAIWVNGVLVPASKIVATDLTDWRYTPKDGQVAVDPERGQIVFSPSVLPKRSDRVRVSYHYGFSADIGGGEYDRPIVQSQGAVVFTVGADSRVQPGTKGDGPEMERQQSGLQDRFQQRLLPWTPSENNPEYENQPADAVIEIASNDFISIPIQIKLKENHRLQIRAANGYSPIIWIPDQSPSAPDAFGVTLSPGSQLTLDGLLIANRSVFVTTESEPNAKNDDCPASLVIRHCTLVPGWGLEPDCNPKEPAEPSLVLDKAQVEVRIEHSIVGSIQVDADTVSTEPIPIEISDSILDATNDDTDSERYALSAGNGAIAHVDLTARRVTIFGIVEVHGVELAENSIFYDCVNVARRQIGCMRFCYIPPGCRTPRRFHCQPDLAEQAMEEDLRKNNTSATRAEIDAAREIERERVRPQFTQLRYGQPAYCQLAETCAEEIKRGADDESEMGVFHDLFQPQREANLRARLDEYTPAGMSVGIIFVC
jgi:hypothetical protein